MKKYIFLWMNSRLAALLLYVILLILIFAPDIQALAQRKGWFVWEHTHQAPLATLLSSNDAGLYFAIGNYYFGGSKNYDVERAQGYFEKVIMLDPAYPRAHYQLGRTLFVQGDFYPAKYEINKELELHPDFWRSYYVRALIRGYSNDLVGAAEDFKTFLRYSPKSWAAHNDLAWVYFQMGDYKKVRDIAREGLQYAPDNAWLNNSLGIALMNLGDNEGAIEALKKAGAIVASMTSEDWGTSYPGNNPLIYQEGLNAMRVSINENLALLKGTSTQRVSDK